MNEKPSIPFYGMQKFWNIKPLSRSGFAVCILILEVGMKSMVYPTFH